MKLRFILAHKFKHQVNTMEPLRMPDLPQFQGFLPYRSCFIKINWDVLALELPDVLQAVEGVSGKSADGMVPSRFMHKLVCFR